MSLSHPFTHPTSRCAGLYSLDLSAEFRIALLARLIGDVGMAASATHLPLPVNLVAHGLVISVEQVDKTLDGLVDVGLITPGRPPEKGKHAATWRLWSPKLPRPERPEWLALARAAS